MIYFVQSPDVGAVKIGMTERLEERLKDLENHYGRPLVVLATMPGGYPEESAIHARFKHLRFKKRGVGKGWEQFRPAADLMEFIGKPSVFEGNPDDVEMMVPSGWRPFDPRYAKADERPPVRVPVRNTRRDKPGLVNVIVQLDPADVALADAISATLAAQTGAIPSRVRAVRWAIRELAARLELGHQLSGDEPSYVASGTMVEPPE